MRHVALTSKRQSPRSSTSIPCMVHPDVLSEKSGMETTPVIAGQIAREKQAYV